MTQPLKKSQEQLRGIVAAALCDLVAYLASYPDSFVVGGQYPKDKLVLAFTKWKLARKINTTITDKEAMDWLNICNYGFLNNSDEDNSEENNSGE